MIGQTILITLSFLGILTAWHFWRNRSTFKEAYARYKTMLQDKQTLEAMQKKAK